MNKRPFCYYTGDVLDCDPKTDIEGGELPECCLVPFCSGLTVEGDPCDPDAVYCEYIGRCSYSEQSKDGACSVCPHVDACAEEHHELTH